ncbi:MAG: hypothetical protein AAF934_08315 [Bacteroidota bacterium]
MNKTFRKRQGSFLRQLILLTLLLYIIHRVILYALLKETTLFYPLWAIYLFHVVTVFSVHTTVSLKHIQGKKKVFYTFMVLTFLKMALAIVFLLPLLFSEMDSKQADVFNFFIPYFLFLALEVTAIAKFLKNS